MGDRTLVRHSTNMLEPDVVRWSMLHHLPDPIASASYQSALCYAYYPFCSGGSWVPAQQVPHRCLMTAMRALQMHRWDGQLAKKPGAATTCIRDAQHSLLRLQRQHQHQHQLLCQSSQLPVAHSIVMLAMMS